jgi:hypothetical protein
MILRSLLLLACAFAFAAVGCSEKATPAPTAQAVDAPTPKLDKNKKVGGVQFKIR